MNDFTSPDVYREVIVTSVCRDCNKSFQSKVQYDKNGATVSFRAKYCKECSERLRKSWNSVAAVEPFGTYIQNDFNKKQSEFNDTILEYINKIKTLLIALHIMVLGLFIFDLGVVWYIIKH